MWDETQICFCWPLSLVYYDKWIIAGFVEYIMGYIMALRICRDLEEEIYLFSLSCVGT